MRSRKTKFNFRVSVSFLSLGHELEKLRPGHHAKFANELLRHPSLSDVGVELDISLMAGHGGRQGKTSTMGLRLRET
jgi:hypothetical protein